jgi:hypothetical protein
MEADWAKKAIFDVDKDLLLREKDLADAQKDVKVKILWKFLLFIFVIFQSSLILKNREEEQENSISIVSDIDRREAILK